MTGMEKNGNRFTNENTMCFNFAVPGVLCGLAGGTWDARLQVMKR